MQRKLVICFISASLGIPLLILSFPAHPRLPLASFQTFRQNSLQVVHYCVTLFIPCTIYHLILDLQREKAVSCNDCGAEQPTLITATCISWVECEQCFHWYHTVFTRIVLPIVHYGRCNLNFYYRTPQFVMF